MKNQFGRIFCAALCLWMTGCSITPHGENSIVSSDSEVTIQNTGISTTATTIATFPIETTTLAASGFDAGTTTEATTISAMTTTVTTTARFPAESSDYGRSDEPHPLNFTYVFTTEGIGLRIEGGNYQTLHYPLSTDTAAYLADNYIIQDCNFDGCYDLLLPVKQSNDAATFALFLWDEGVLQYRKTPIELVNPRFHAAEKTVHSRVKGSAVAFTYEIYQWVGGDLQRVAQYVINTEMRTVTTILYENGSITQHTVDNYDDDTALQVFIDGL